MLAYSMWSQDGEVEYGSLEEGKMMASGMSDDAHSVVGIVSEEAVIWDEINGLRTLEDVLTAQNVDLQGWELTNARAISPDGHTIVGIGKPAGSTHQELWIITLPDECISPTAYSAAQAEIAELKAQLGL
jgi:hypothetical protein